MKIKKEELIHIIIIVVGTLFLLISAFHTNVWFDESYSVAMSKHDFFNIWDIGSYDVHPVLYYFILHILNLIFGYNILVYRLFSVVCISILSILGFTHIRKDFGVKQGLIFSFLVLFLPVNVVYATEIRMYSLAMLLVSIVAIYAYRIYKEDKIKNWILFTIFSILASYTHYYGLATCGIVYILLFTYFIKNLIVDIKNKEIKTKTKKDLVKFFTSGALVFIVYLPWIMVLLRQVGSVSKGFWISVSDKTFIEILKFCFTGNLGDTEYINGIIALIFSIFSLIYAGVILVLKIKKKEDVKPAIFSIAIFLIVIFVIAIISIKMPILYARYMLNMLGLLIFFLSFMMAKGNKYINIFIVAIIVIMSIYVNVNVAIVNYDKINSSPIDFIKSEIKKDDIIIYCNQNNYDFGGFIVSVNFKDYTQYFYDIENWNVENAYKAYGPNMKTIYNLDEIKDFKGRIWIIECVDYHLLEEYILKEYDNVNIEKQEMFTTKYKNLRYAISLVTVN